MSTIALNLPMNYVDVDSEEMQYIEGGGYVTLVVTKATLIDIATAGASAAGAIIGNLIAGPYGAIIGGALGWIVGGIVARGNITSDFTWSGYIWGASGYHAI